MRLRASLVFVAAATVTVTGWWLLSADAVVPSDTRFPAVITGASMSLILPGLVGMWRRPDDHTPFRATVAGISLSLSYFRALSSPWAATIGAFAWYASPLALAWLLLGWHRPSRDDRSTVACWLPPFVAAAGLVLVSGARHIAPVLGTSDLRSATWVHLGVNDEYVRQANPLGYWASTTGVRALWLAWIAWVVAVSAVTAARLVRHATARRGAPSDHALDRLVGAAGVVNLVAALALVVLSWPDRVSVRSPSGSIVIGRWYSDLLLVVPVVAAAVSGAAMVWSELVRPRLSRTSSGAIQLATSSSPDTVRLDLARALGDPTVRLLFPRADAGWVDDRGRPALLAVEAHRAATILTAGDQPMAAIEYDASLLEQPDLVEVAATSAALSLDSQRLAALASAAATDARSSAARLLAAADDARQTVERRIADGPDRILAGVALMLEERPVPLGAVHDGLRDAVADLRHVARGLAPIALSDEGLTAALDDLAASSPTPVRFEVDSALRLPTAIEVTIYMVASAALSSTTAPVGITVSSTSAVATVEVDGWSGPLEQVTADRVATLGGVVDVGPSNLAVSLPFDA